MTFERTKQLIDQKKNRLMNQQLEKLVVAFLVVQKLVRLSLITCVQHLMSALFNHLHPLFFF